MRFGCMKCGMIACACGSDASSSPKVPNGQIVEKINEILNRLEDLEDWRYGAPRYVEDGKRWVKCEKCEKTYRAKTKDDPCTKCGKTDKRALSPRDHSKHASLGAGIELISSILERLEALENKKPDPTIERNWSKIAKLRAEVMALQLWKKTEEAARQALVDRR